MSAVLWGPERFEQIGDVTNPIFGYFHFFSFIIPVAVGIRVFGRLNRAMRVLVVLCALACVNVGLQFLLSLWRIRNYIVADFYRMVEVLLLCGVFCLAVRRAPVRRVLASLALIFAIVWAVDFASSNGHEHLNSSMAMTSRMFLLVMSLITLHSEVKSERTTLAERSVFWISAAVALYSSGTFMVLAFSNYLLKLGRPYFDVAWHINWGLLIVANLMYTKGMMCKPQA